METVWLEDFVALASSGNFSRAAVARNITQPAFSRRVRALERWVGAPLFERTVQGARLTPAGEEFARGAAQLLRSAADLRLAARETAGRETSTLRFAATHSLSFTFFPTWLRALESGAAVGPVRLMSDSMQACEDLMTEGQSQFMLCHFHPAAPGRLDSRAFVACEVGQDSLVPVTAPTPRGAPLYPLGSPGTVPLLGYTPDSGLGRILGVVGEAQRAMTPALSAQLASTLLGVARSGRGVAWVPQTLAADDLARGTLVLAGGPQHAIPLAIRLVRQRGRQSPAAERLWSHCAGA